MTSQPASVTVIGLGLMGRALAKAFMNAGHPTTVWNRTPSRAEGLVAEGAALAASVGAALAASPITVCCVSDYESLRRLYEVADGELVGRVLVNLTSGDSAQAADMAHWTQSRGARYVDGAIMAIPPAIGTTDATILISGPREDYESSRAALDALGTVTYLGEAPGLSALYDAAGLTMMWSVLNAWLHGVALLRTAGIDAQTYTGFAVRMAEGTTGWLADYAEQIDTETYPPDDATLDTHAGGMAQLLSQSEALGVNADLPRLFKALADRAVAAGDGGRSYPALIAQFTPTEQPA